MTVVRKQSKFSGKWGEMDLPLTQQELDEGLKQSWSANPGIGTKHMQDIFPQLNADQREFLMSGCTPEEWNEMFAYQGEDDE